MQDRGEMNVTHLGRAGTKVLKEHKEVVMVWKSSRKIRMRCGHQETCCNLGQCDMSILITKEGRVCKIMDKDSDGISKHGK
jgi:predicted RNA-binding protein (virulence factor B family)